ncbi:MAG TPA: RluA family pseudouridine synthase [Elusimicrobiales bacterium]|nr:RluA family pseudouridine synthase [Elusimicrobiales bacterium]
MSHADRIMRCTIRPEEAGRSLLSFLEARFPYRTGEEWRGLVGAGAIMLNDEPVAPERVLAEKDVLRYYPADKPERGVDRNVTVLYDDADIIVVGKTGNLPVHPAGNYFKNTLWWILKEQLGVASPGIINRLDRETSGVTLIAKNPRANKSCREQFTARKVTKKYTVFVEGAFGAPVRARGYITAGPTSVIRKKQRFEPAACESPEPGREAQWAETQFTLLERRGAVSVLEAVPHTGRLHQIRATLLALGWPVVGDKMYGLDEGVFPRFLEDLLTPADAALMRLGRQALHASELTFRHPATGAPLTITAPLPPDMRALLG